MGVAVLGGVGAGCGDDDEAGAAGAARPDPGAGGAIAWELAERPRTFDPLYAQTPAERLIARQIAEPLVESLSGPFGEPGDMRRSPGLAVLRPSSGDRIWSARLRSGVSFQDGSPFDAAAVLANVSRWAAQPSLSGMPPGLLADSPKPGLVRFILPAPDPVFDRRLATSPVGIVSTRAIEAAGAGPVDAATAADAGTGPFELRERDADRLLLARNTEWWGAERELGPGVDQIEFSVVADRGERYDRLSAGEVQVAEELARHQVAEAREDPLLTVVPLRGAGPLAVERSVRGIPEDMPAPPLSGMWRTGLAGP